MGLIQHLPEIEIVGFAHTHVCIILVSKVTVFKIIYFSNLTDKLSDMWKNHVAQGMFLEFHFENLLYFVCEIYCWT